jgi:hypothetical protein
LREAIIRCVERGELPQLDGAFGYAVEILAELGHPEPVFVIVGAIRGGALGRLRQMTAPPDRRPAEALERARAALPKELRDQAAARGAAMSYDELVAWLVQELDALLDDAA